MGQKVAIVTGASSGIGLGLTQTLLERGYAVVGTSREASRKMALPASKSLALVDGDVGDASTADKVVQTALSKFERLDLLVNNAGIFIAKPFTGYSADDFARLVSTNLAGFFHMTRAALRPMLAQKSGHIVSITTSLAVQPIAGIPSGAPMLTKGGIEAATRSLAIEYVGQGVRVNAVSPGIIDTPMNPKDKHAFLDTLQPMGRIGTVQDIAEAVLYLDHAPFVTGEILRVDGGAHAGKW